MKRSITAFAILTICFSTKVFGQIGSGDIAGQRNVITTAVPFLNITPDTRAAGMGDIGVATDPDVNSNHWNSAKLAFADEDAQLGLSAAPWLQQLVPDVWFYYLSGYGKVGADKRSALGMSLRYFTLGSIQFTDFQGNPQGNYKPYEMALDGSFSRQLSRNFSMGIALRFTLSDLARGASAQLNGTEVKAGIAGSGDLGAYWKDELDLGSNTWDYAIGLNLSNMGSKITYTDEANQDFIPTNMRLGTWWSTEIDQYNKIGFGVDINKLLVPTPDTVDSDNDGVYDYRTKPVLGGMVSSFGDAPGGFNEELKEYIWSVGMEYWYQESLALRLGYFNEAESKGARKYFTVGVGLRYKAFGLDAAYLQPITGNHPLRNTIRFSLTFTFGEGTSAEDSE